jgi:hypothetical protein
MKGRWFSVLFVSGFSMAIPQLGLLQRIDDLKEVWEHENC